MRKGLLLVAMLVVGIVADSVQFLNADYTTRGNWKGVYGADGYRTAMKTAPWATWTDSIPSYATFSDWTPSTVSQAYWPWLSNWAVSYPQHPTGSGRLGATAYFPHPTTYDEPGMWITLTVTGTRDVHLYSLDGHIHGGRRNTIRVRLGTAQSGTAAHTYAITTDMRPGIWTSYRISGTVTFEIAKAGQYDAVLTAFMFDTPLLPPTPTPPTPAPTPNPQICAGACLFTLCETIDQIIAVTVTGTSSNLVWGTETFTDDSDVGAASVHAGKVAIGETKAVTVRCAGPKSSFVGSTANGITSKSLGPWGASFSFDLEGKEPASPPAPERCFHEPCALPKCVVQGTQFDMVVVGATRGDLVWGTHTYTTDSHLGTAAVHAGLLANGVEGAVTVVCTGAQSSYAGTEQNGVTTTGYGPWGFSMQLKAGPPTPPPSTAIVCKEACVVGRCTEGSSHRIRVAGLTYGYGWGSATYADDTHVGMAAVHAGVVSAGQTAEVLLTCTGAQSSFTGTTANGITTSSYGSWPASFTLAAAPAPTVAVCEGLCMHNVCGIIGEVHHLSITGTTGGSLWGTSIYSDDSSVPTAAVHAGLVAAGETKTLVATCTGPQETYEGSTSNQVTSNPFGYWARSYTLQ